MKGSELIENAFSLARDEGCRVLIGFLTAGDPGPKHTLRLAESLIQGGIDILELGIPFSDPVADGAAIQAADTRALKAGATPQSTLRTVKEIRHKDLTKKQDIPVVLLSYFNPILKFGVDKFLNAASENGVSGMVVPDLTFAVSGDSDEKKEDDAGAVFSRICSKNGIATVMMAAPTTPSLRLNKLISETEGFLYLVSLLGVTGSRKASQSIDSPSLKFVQSASRVAREKSKKIAVGFGISRPEHTRDVLNAGADGVIVGSFFVNLVASNLDDIDRACKLLAKSARKLKQATYYAY